MVTSLTDKFSKYIRSIINKSNVCLIYEQLIKIQKDEKSLNEVKKMIQFNTSAAFNSEYFQQLSEDALIGILNLDYLSTKEIDILRACHKWLENNLKKRKVELTIQNKREAFKSIKHLINFARISENDFKNFEEKQDLLTFKEIGGIYFLHGFDQEVIDSSLLPFECKTKRKELLPSIFMNSDPVISKSIPRNDPILIRLNSNQQIIISKISTYFLKPNVEGLELSVNEDGIELELDIVKRLVTHGWEFEFYSGLMIKPNKTYIMTFKYDILYVILERNEISNKMLDIGCGEIRITLRYNGVPYIKEVEFFSFK